MRHDWIIDVLTDLRSYSQMHGMAALAQKVDEALSIARVEIGKDPENTGGGPSGTMN